MQQRFNQSDIFQFGSFRLIASERLLLKEHTPVALGGRALDILIALLEQAGEVVSHGELVKRVWQDVIVEETSLRVHIAALRRSLGDGRDGARYIANVPGRGYCFVASVRNVGQNDNSKDAAIGRGKMETLPPRLLRMIGRDQTVRALRSEVMSRRFVSIVGPGGVGKTTVAVAVGHAMATEFDEAVYFVDLSALRDSALVIPAVASALQCLEQTQDSLTRLLTFVASKRILLILDSCEHLVESVATLTDELFHAAPLVHILATTREALRVEGENIQLLKSLDSPLNAPRVTAAAAMMSPAVQLFMERAAAGGYRTGLTDEDAPAVADICRQLDGMPLAIELTASRSSTYGIGGLAQLIGERLMLVWHGRRSVPRHQTLQAMLDWSYDLLSELEKSVLCSMSVFVGTFTLDMAHAITSSLGCDEMQLANVVTSLVDKSLISVARTEGISSYRLLDTTRAYAVVKLQERGETNTIARRHALHFAERLDGMRANILKGGDLSACSRYVGDIRAALEWSFSESGDGVVGAELAAAAVPLFLGLSMLGECRRWCLQTLNALPERDRGTRLEMELQLSLATSSNHLYGDTTEVGTALERGLGLADTLGDTEYQMELLAGLNLYRARLADFGGSLAAAERYAVIAKEFDRPREIVAAEWMLGASYHLVGNQAAAQRSYEKGFELASTGVSDLHSFGYDHQVRALIGYARTLCDRGFPDRAVQFAYQGIEVADRQEHPVSLCICLTHATPVFLWRGDQQIAEELIERLITLAARHSLSNYQAGGLGLRGQLMLARGQTQRGVETLSAALSTMQTAQRYILSTTFSVSLAQGLARIGRPAEATIIIDGLMADPARGSATFERPDLLRVRAEVQLATSPKNWRAAEASLKESIDCARQQSALGRELGSTLALGRLWVDHDHADEARALLADIYGRFTEGFGTVNLTEARSRLRELGAPTSRSGKSSR